MLATLALEGAGCLHLEAVISEGNSNHGEEERGRKAGWDPSSQDMLEGASSSVLGYIFRKFK